MGFPPPQDAPPPDQQDAVDASASFAAGPPAASLCGFKFPTLAIKIGFRIHLPKFPPPLPSFFLQFGLNCDLDNPLSMNAGVAYGGGRAATQDPDPDLAEAA